MRPGMITPGKLLITPSGKIGRCGYTYVFSEAAAGCCCFLQPDPPAWDEHTVYPLNACVSHCPTCAAWNPNQSYNIGAVCSHNGYYWYAAYGTDPGQEPGVSAYWVAFNWYNRILGNQGNEPGIGEGWVRYFHCRNDDWDSVPPFGGIGKAPLYYAVSWRVYYTYPPRYDVKGHVYAAVPFYAAACKGVVDEVDAKIVVIPGDSASECAGERTCKVKVRFRLQYPTLPGLLEITSWQFGYTGCCSYVASIMDFVEFPACQIQGSIETQKNGRSISASWRPLDCDYELWSADTTYGNGACVAWDGRFYRSCAANNQGHPPEPDASNVCEAGYWWRLA